ncbi:hypothetical protein SPRG_04898 [Saprolegnia parasitica CBS 223.65]|uniref:F-box domain-containing protein n=1 Tax=Saprolegnia parasitica (strain CBS 223.65) TaxID=695850 RepID=A0A067CH23_SAPPC|nr:hypothetical protein SPRG_04898 [Saprolegnia parasitica CBS 223.65]KDO29783.1 hypothetical protein SPRG_04898 [Saprolegnia parasitica CBS 223.65]|eukprot:XP_012199428.1 hypothetical protein SPRG_04898 [Saprolegnia parasitica CBS 223.65]
MAKRAKPTPALLPELFEQVGRFIMTSTEMAAFLEALPVEWLSEPLAALLELFRAVRSRRLMVPAGDVFHPCHVRLWPYFELPYEVTDPQLRGWIAKAMVLSPVVDINGFDLPPSYPLQPRTRINLHAVSTWEMLQRAIELWPERIECIEISFGDDVNNQWPAASVGAMREALRTLPALREVAFTSHSNVINRDPLPLIQALAPTSIICAELIYPHVTWSTATVTAMANWLRTGSLKVVVLEGACMTDADGTTLCKAIADSSTLLDLEIKGGSLPFRFFKDIPALPSQLHSLVLELLVHDDLPAITSVLSSSQLQLVTLGFETVSPNPAPAATLAMIQALGRLRRLRRLELTMIELSPACVASLALLLPQMTNFYLEASGLGDDEIGLLAAVLPRCPSLGYLHLIDQACTYVGAMALAAAVPLCPPLRKIDLRGNRIGSIGAHALSSVLPHLLECDLSENKIGFDGALAISRVVPATCHMEMLGLQGNPLEKEGLLAIIHALEHCVHRDGVIKVSDTLALDEDRQECDEAVDRLPDAAWITFREDEPFDG